jgi:hypothetical protein
MNAYVYVLSCPLGLVKVGVAADPKQRLRNLQIGSPVPLELAAQYAMSDRPSARSATGRRRRASRVRSSAPANGSPARPPRSAAAASATPAAASGASTQASGRTCKLAVPNCGPRSSSSAPPSEPEQQPSGPGRLKGIKDGSNCERRLRAVVPSGGARLVLMSQTSQNATTLRQLAAGVASPGLASLAYGNRPDHERGHGVGPPPADDRVEQKTDE